VYDVFKSACLVDELLKITFPKQYNPSAQSRLDSMINVGQMIKAPVTYKAYVGSGAAKEVKKNN
jgi:hypothetical protein